MQLIRDVVGKEVIGEVPSGATKIKVSKAGSTQEPSIVLIKGSSSLPTFAATKDWCLIAKTLSFLSSKKVQLTFW